MKATSYACFYQISWLTCPQDMAERLSSLKKPIDPEAAMTHSAVGTW